MNTPDAKTKRNNPVLMAARKNEPGIVAAILSHRIAPRIDVNERDEDGCSALGYLAQISMGEDSRLAVQALIDAGAAVDTQEPDLQARSSWNYATNSYDRSLAPLVLLSIRQPHGSWKLVFERLGPKRLKALSGELPLLHESLILNLRAASDLLLAAGADVNREDPRMGLPIACCSTPADFAMLIAAGARINVSDSQGRPALQLVGSSSASLEILSMAAAAAQAESLGQVATFKEGRQHITKARQEIAQPLIESLFHAIANKQPERVDSLWKTLNLGRDKARLSGARDQNGQSLLHGALAVHNFGLSRRLLRHGLSPNVFDHVGRTPLSILMGLPYAHSERDRSGDKRLRIFREVFDKVDWDARSPAGIGYYETLLCVSMEGRNGVSSHLLFTKASATRPDWLALSSPGATCALSRVLALAVQERRPPSDSILLHQERVYPMHALLTAQIARPEFGEPQARSVLEAALSKPQNENLQNIPSWLEKTLEAIEAHLDVFKATGVDPNSIAWASGLAIGRPTLFASIESWILSGASPSVPTPRARARSL